MYPSMRASSDLFADLEQFQDRLDELRAGRMAPSSSIRAVGRASAFPYLNVGTSADALEIYAFAPGVGPADIEITVEKGLLTIAGERSKGTSDEKPVAMYAQERFRGPFRRVVSLPDDADAGRVEANYRNGVLRILVPKRESAKARRIAVSGQA